MINKIIEYEQKIYSQKMELNKLISEVNNSEPNEDIDIINFKINMLKREILDMNNEIELLKIKVNSPLYKKQMMEKKMGTREAMSMKSNVTHENIQKTPVNLKETTNTPIKKTIYYNKPKKPAARQGNAEEMIGKVLMGGLASVLIFIGLISFATLLLPLLGDVFKVILMFAVSGAILGLGFSINKKDNTNKLGISLMGCGFGAIYISLFVTSAYFNMLNQYILYALIIVWSLTLMKLSDDSIIMKIIGQVGIVLSVYFGCMNSSTTPIIFVVFYALIIEDIFIFYSLKKKDTIDYCDYVALFLSTVMFEKLSMNGPVENMIGSILLTVNMFAIFGITLYLVKEKEMHISKYIMMIIFSFFTYSSVFIYFEYKDELFCLILLTAIIVTEKFISEKYQKEKPLIVSALGLLTAYCLFAVTNMSSLWSSTVYYSNTMDAIISMFYINVLGFIVAGMFLFVGFKKKRPEHKVLGLVFILGSLLSSENEYLQLIFLAACTLEMIYLVIKEKQAGSKAQIAALSLIMLSINTIYEAIPSYLLILTKYDELIFIISIIALCSFVYKTKFRNNWIDNKPEQPFVYFITAINAFATLYTIHMINSQDFMPTIICILVAIAGFSMTATDLIRNENPWIQAYVPFKYCFLICYILNALYFDSIAISIVLLVAAAITIIIGFLYEFKSFRLYGLALSFLSIAKLLLLDISYENSIEKTLSFFLCGIICFGISYVYTKLDKKLNKK